MLFLGSHTPHRPDTGEVVAGSAELPADALRAVATGAAFVDIRADRFTAQTWQCLRNLEATLAAAGATLAHLALLRVVLRRSEDGPFLARTLAALLPVPLPAVDVMVCATPGSDPAIDIVLDGVATHGGSAAPEKLTLPELAGLTQPYATLARAGGLVFTSNLPGIDPGTGAAPERSSDLPPEFRSLVEACRPADREIERFLVQQAVMWRNLRRLLDLAGIAPADVLYHNAWLLRSMQFLAYGSVARALGRDFDGFALSCFPVTALPGTASLWTGRLVTRDPAGAMAKRVVGEPHALSRSYHGIVQAGPVVMTAGEVPIDLAVPRLIEGPRHLSAAVRGIATGRSDRAGPAAAQAAHVYGLLAEGLDQYGTGLGQVVHQTIYLADLADTATVLLVALSMFGGALPATSIVPVLGATAYDGALIEIEVTAAAGPA
ncbi:RidA family protein [Stella sp.]|uniref:RidA family protein n=1 Tax=Stella sp. TaxID=2912054 RepID=UPI0035B35A6D